MQTIENTREKDETIVAADEVEVQADEEQDEFAGNLGYETMSLLIAYAANLLSSLHLLVLPVMYLNCRALSAPAASKCAPDHLLQAKWYHVQVSG